MKIIDLSLPISSQMPVFPGDPKPKIELIQTFEKDEWNMRRIEINSHDGTHVNVPIHCTKDGKNLDDYELGDFIGESRIYKNKNDIQSGEGVIFRDINIDQNIAQIILEKKPKFVGLSCEFDFDIEVERFLLERGIISFERLNNTEQLPDSFYFYGVPLQIEEGDGSPVRAYAIIDDKF